MKVVAFLGPTLQRAEASALIDAEFRPPAQQGDVYCAARDGAKIICLIDGAFLTGPSVWHKEILWAMTAGTAVFGAASIGALRAAELHAYGMRGVGRVYRHYRQNACLDEDEVALQFAPEELGYSPLSEALVDIRATMDRAVTAQVATPQMQKAAIETTRALFFPERRWPRILKDLRSVVDGAEVDRLQTWLDTGRYSVKGADARLLFRLVDHCMQTGKMPPAIPFEFPETDLWQQMIERLNNPFLKTL